MLFRFKNFATTALFLATTLLGSATVNAAVVTHGFLVTDDTTDYITDINTGRQYTRFDAYNLSYADTLLAVGAGGAYEGWSIATAAISDEFIAAALGTATTPCTGNNVYGELCGTLSGWSEGDFGLSYNPNLDLYAYLSALPGNEISLVGFHSDGSVRDYPNWHQVFHLDEHGGAVYPGNPINLLLFREASTPVPVPVSIVLFTCGLVLLGSRRRV